MNPHTLTPDLTTIHQNNAWNGTTIFAKLIERDGAPAIEFNREDFNLIWLDGLEFTDGIIELDIKGKSKPPQGSFVGVAFRVMDEVTYDSVYFRPFNFGAHDKERKSHAVQYISHPEWPWYRLRQEKTGQFEHPVDPTPDGDMWFHTRIEINDRHIKVFVNNSQKPSLDVIELSNRTDGAVGIWCFGYGVITNLRIMPLE